MFKALKLSRDNDQFVAAAVELDEDQIPQIENAVTLDIAYSTVNYKDALALTNRSPIVRKWPLVPGIDGAGAVLHSSDPDIRSGDQVILNGWGVGESHWGCLAQKARLKAEWLVPLPPTLSPWHAMAVGTAGYTAMLCVLALEQEGVMPDNGEILVTGASGGVGSLAVTLLAGLGYRVCASTGKLDESDYLKSLGASEIIDRASLSGAGRPLQRERFAGVVDSVGSHTLANACAQTRYGGVVTACGLAQGMDFPASVAPFILRAVKLVGIDSVMAPREKRLKAWARLARDLDLKKLSVITNTVGLAQALSIAPQLLDGKIRGRIVVDVNA
ncbi:MAG: MDR family oxidoreductase [Burkholderiaceae bacterium]